MIKLKKILLIVRLATEEETTTTTTLLMFLHHLSMQPIHIQPLCEILAGIAGEALVLRLLVGTLSSTGMVIVVVFRKSPIYLTTIHGS